MKKLIAVLFLLTLPVFAQTSDKGTISVAIDNEKYDLPVRVVSLRKDNNIVLSATAEQNDANEMKMVGLELGLKSLSGKDNDIDIDGFSFNFNEKNNAEQSGKSLSLRFGKEGHGSFGIYSKGEGVKWEVNSISMKLNLSKVELKDGVLTVEGKFNITVRSAMKEKAMELKECSFVIKI